MVNIDDPRNRLLIRQALVFAIEALAELPAERRPESNISDMRAMLNDENPVHMAQDQRQARSWLDWLRSA